MAKEIIDGAAECATGESADQALQFRAVVFKQLPASADFEQSEAIVLPGWHTAEAAWAAVHGALGAGGAALIGGEIRPA